MITASQLNVIVAVGVGTMHAPLAAGGVAAALQVSSAPRSQVKLLLLGDLLEGVWVPFYHSVYSNNVDV